MIILLVDKGNRNVLSSVKEPFVLVGHAIVICRYEYDILEKQQFRLAACGNLQILARAASKKEGTCDQFSQCQEMGTGALSREEMEVTNVLG